MSQHNHSPAAPARGPSTHPARERAADLLERWRRLGFTLVTCYPSGYCCPTTAAAMRNQLPSGYRAHPIDAAEALAAVTTFVATKSPYQV